MFNDFFFQAKTKAKLRSHGKRTFSSIPNVAENLQSDNDFQIRYEDDGISRRIVKWDEQTKQFQTSRPQYPKSLDTLLARGLSVILQYFFPDNVSPDYFRYTTWRSLHRLMSSTLSVFGTQALLLALGINSNQIGSAAAANWVLKDTLGKFGRILWAGKMGKRFDSDAKKWRYRTSLLYTAGTGLEVITYLFPSFFLLLATVSNALKQMSMLTFAATRNTFYRSFASKGENIGDITAKGEAQISFVDLLGMLLGIYWGKMIGNSKQTLAFAYLCCSAIEIFSIYKEIRAVVFRTFNHERTALVLTSFIRSNFKETEILPPERVAIEEPIFFPSKFKMKENFGTVSEISLTNNELQQTMKIFSEEKYFLAMKDQDTPTIILHSDADNSDIFQAMFTLECARARLINVDTASFSNIKQCFKDALKDFEIYFSRFEVVLREKGWDQKVYLYKDIKKRNYWLRKN